MDDGSFDHVRLSVINEEKMDRTWERPVRRSEEGRHGSVPRLGRREECGASAHGRYPLTILVGLD